METLDRLQAVYAKWEKQGSRKGPQVGQTLSDNKTQHSGKQAWHDKFLKSDMQAPRSGYYRNRQRYRSSQPIQDLPVNTQLSNLAYFKWRPSILPQSDQFKRVFMGRCCSCLPNSKNEFFEDNMESQGLVNILDVDTKRGRGLQSVFYHISFALMRQTNHKYPRVSMRVLSNPRVVQAIQMSVQENAEAEGKLKDEAKMRRIQVQEERRTRSLVRRLSADLSNLVIRFTGYFLHKFLPCLYTTIVVHKAKINMIKQALKTGLPVIYLPTHRSHMDYILMTFTLWNFDIQAPHVAAGDNLLIPVFGFLMRKLGGFFIRRKLDGKDGKKDLTYRAVLHTYMEEILKRGETMEFFLEAGRSRSGKVLPPKGGLLSVIVEGYLEGAIPDAYLIPANFSYEKLLEGNFNAEQMGESKTTESFLNTMRATWRALKTQYGSVRIEFGQPFSLREYMQVSQSYDVPHDHLSQWEKASSPVTINSKFDSTSSLFGVEEHRHAIQSLAQHVMYNCMTIQAVMSTHMVAFLLLTKHRKGVQLKELEESMSWLRQELSQRHRDVGFSGKHRDVIMHATDLLGPGLVSVSRKTNQGEDQNNNEDNIVFTPNLQLPNIFELSYYANVVISVFALESIMAMATCSLTGDRLWLRDGSDDDLTISRVALLQRAIDLCHLLQFEFIYKPPCTTWIQMFNDAVDQLIVNEILITVEDPQNMWTKRLSRQLNPDSDEEDEEREDDTTYLVNRENQHSLDRLKLLVSVIRPLIETYHITACQALTLKENRQTEKSFSKQVHDVLKSRVAENITEFAESVSSDTLRNAMRSLHQLRILESIHEGRDVLTGIHHSTEALSRLDQVLDILDACRVCEMV